MLDKYEYEECIDICNEIKKMVRGNVFFSNSSSGCIIFNINYKGFRYMHMITNDELHETSRYTLVDHIVNEYKKDILIQFLK